MKAVFSHKPNSQYDDIKGVQYHFPKLYLSRVKQSIGDWFVYYEQLSGMNGRYYTGCGLVKSIVADNNIPDHYYAELSDFIDFDRLLEYREKNGFELKLVGEDGSINGGTAQSAVRIISDVEFEKIISAALSEKAEWPDRNDSMQFDDDMGFSDIHSEQPEIIGAPYERKVLPQLLNRKWRDDKFKLHIRKAYDRRCAFTGLRLINGRGRPEVEAAHIRPVEFGGNDWVRNGIALSGTVHWMFDRGLLSLGDDFEILKSRKLNHDVSGLLRKERTALVPTSELHQPHPEYLKWHRAYHQF
jgi:putative restriction endonuclease